MKTNRNPLLPLAATFLFALSAPAGAKIDQSRTPYYTPDAGGGFDSAAYRARRIMGPLTVDQQTQYEAWSRSHPEGAAATATTPPEGQETTRPAVGPNKEVVQANPQAAMLNDGDRALIEAGYGGPVPQGQLPPGTTISDHSGKRSVCNFEGCTPCPASDCAQLIPQQPVPQAGLLAGGPNPPPDDAETNAAPGGSAVRGQNSKALHGMPGGAQGFSSQNGGAGYRRPDEPRQPIVISALVEQVVLPAVDPLMQGSGGDSGPVAAGGSSGVTAVAERKLGGGNPSVHYSGGSFRTLEKVNESETLGQVSGFAGETAVKSEALKAARTGKQTNSFGTTKGDSQ